MSNVSVELIDTTGMNISSNYSHISLPALSTGNTRASAEPLFLGLCTTYCANCIANCALGE